jgi:hypothetical protein
LDGGAKNVVWLKPKVDVAVDSVVRLDIDDNKSLFDRWVDKDKPDLNIKLLKMINEEIIQEVSKGDD